MSTIKDRVRVVLEGDPILSSIILNEWPLHGWTHEAGGLDEIDVTGLDGLLSDPQNAGWLKGFPLDFSTAPTSGQVLVFDGTSWVPGPGSGVTSLNSLQGDLALLYGPGILITDDSSSDITISNTGVLSIESLIGDVSFATGAGLSITDNGTDTVTFSNSGVLSLSVDDDADELAGHLKLEQGTNILITKLDDDTGFRVDSINTEIRYYASSISVVTGTYTGGSVGDTHDWSEDPVVLTYDVDEVTGAPGFDVRATFTGVPGFTKFTIRYYYDGPGQVHSVHVEMYNNSTVGWDTFGEFSQSSVFTVLEFPVPSDVNYINGSDEVILRFNHDDNGSTSHDFKIDYMALVAASASAGTVGVLSFTELGDVAQVGAITISEDANIVITRSGKDFGIGAPLAFLHDGSVTATGDFDLGDYGIDNLTYIDWKLDGVTPAEGRQWWDDDAGTLNVGLKGGVSVLQIGQEMPYRCRNTSGALMSDGYLCTVTGNTADNPNISYATGDTRVFAMVTEDIADNQYGYATAAGMVRGLDTSAYSPADELWRDNTTGGVTSTQPTAPNKGTSVGFVVASSATVGSVYSMPHDVPRLSYLSDVNVRATAVADRQILAWDIANLRWDQVLPTFDWIYDAGSKLISADDGAVVISNNGENGTMSLRQLSDTPSGAEHVFEIINDANSLRAINFAGDAGTTDIYTTGNRMWTSNAALSLGTRNTAQTEDAFFAAKQDDYDGTDHAVAFIQAKDDAATYGAIIRADAYDSSVSAFAETDIFLSAEEQVHLSSDQGTPTAPSLRFSTNATTTDYVVVVENDRDFRIIQGRPIAADPLYSELFLGFTAGDPNTQTAQLGAYADAGADGYARVQMTCADATGNGDSYFILSKSGESPVFLHLELDGTDSKATIDAREILYNGCIGQEQSVSLTSSSSTLAVNLSGNHQSWSIGHNITTLTFGTVPDIFGVNFHIWITFTGTFSISAASWPAAVDWVDGSDGLLSGASGETYVLTMQKHGSTYIAAYSDEAV